MNRPIAKLVTKTDRLIKTIIFDAASINFNMRYFL